ncbi:MAG: hypothetical protein WC307_04325 [Candidatus Nanoarchaeia archaeon]|jgi:hypothetical protein
MEGRELLEVILREFPSLDPSYVRGVVGRSLVSRPEIKAFNGVPYLIVADPSLSTEAGRYGLAVRVDGEVTVDDVGFLVGGVTHLGVFGEECDKRAVVSLDGHSCKGMQYEVGVDGGMIKVVDVKDVNMAVNAISNFQLNCVGGGLFNINRFMVEGYTKLKDAGFELPGGLSDLITSNLVNGLNDFISSYEINNDVPLDSIVMKLIDLGGFNPGVINGLLEGHESFTQSVYKSLFNKGEIFTARSLFGWSKISPVFSESVVQSGYDSLLQEGRVDSARYLFVWSKISPVFSESLVQSYYDSFFKKGWVYSARSLFVWSKIKPNNELLTQYKIKPEEFN